MSETRYNDQVLSNHSLTLRSVQNVIFRLNPSNGVFGSKPLNTALNQQKTFGVDFTKYKDWELSVDLNLQANQDEDFKNVLQLMVQPLPSDTVNMQWEESAGGRIPTIYQMPKSNGNKLRIHHHVNGPTYFDTPELAAGWRSLKIANRVNECGSFIYSVSVDGTQVYSVENKTPEVWQNVNAYIANSHLHHGVTGSYKNLRFESILTAKSSLFKLTFSSKSLWWQYLSK